MKPKMDSSSQRQDQSPSSSSSSSSSSPSSSSSSSPATKVSSSVFHNCKVCNKRVMFHNRCKCQDLFCSNHMLNHPCSFDHQGQHKKILEKRNPKIESEKLIQL
jgi:hypothetical protein